MTNNDCYHCKLNFFQAAADMRNKDDGCCPWIDGTQLTPDEFYNTTEAS